MHTRPRWATILVLAGCAGSPAPRETVQTSRPAPEVGDAGARSEDAGVLPAEPRGLRVAERPRTEGCTFTSDHADVAFEPSRDERAFFSARAARVKIQLGQDGAWLEMETRDVRVSGFMPPNFVDLHPRASFLFDEATEVTGSTTFTTPRPAGPAAVQLRLRFGDTQDRSRVVPCDALAPSPVAGAEATRLARDGMLPRAVVPGSSTRPVPVSDVPQGSPVSRLEHGRAVRVLARSGDRAQVSWEQEGTMQVGWVPASAVAPPTTPLVPPGTRVVTLDPRQMRTVGDAEVARAAPRPWPRTVCREDVRLVVEHAGGTRWVIGVLKAGTPLVLLALWSEGTIWEVAPDTLDLDVGEATKLYVPARDVSRACAEQSAP